MRLTDEMIAAALADKRNKRFQCPSCGYKQAVSVSVGEHGVIGFCHACGQSMTEGKPIGKSYTKGTYSFSAPSIDTDKQKRAQDLWNTALPLIGTPGEAYLRARGAIWGKLAKNDLKALRFLPRSFHFEAGQNLPCLLAAVECVGSAELLGVQRIFLSDDGLGKLEDFTPKLSLGCLRGGAVRLGECGTDLALSEGLETGLSFQWATGIPTWACLSTAGLVGVCLPDLPLAARITIAADHDGPGLKAADALADRLVAEGREVRVVFPPEVGTDFNDMTGGADD